MRTGRRLEGHSPSRSGPVLSLKLLSGRLSSPAGLLLAAACLVSLVAPAQSPVVVELRAERDGKILCREIRKSTAAW